MLIWARQHGCPWEEPDEYDGIGFESLTPHCCALAAKGGHLEVLKWLRFGSAEDSHDEEDGTACPWNQSTCAYAAAGGHLEVLKWARAHGCDWDSSDVDSPYDCAALAAQGGHLEMLTWLFEPEHGFDWDDEWTCASAAEGGQLEVLKWLRAHGCEWDARTVEEATAAGHDDVLQWALANGCPRSW